MLRALAGNAGQASAKPQSSAEISASATGPILPSSVLSKVEQYLKKNCRQPAVRSHSRAARLSSTACRTGVVRDFSATTTASALGAASSGRGTPISCTVRIPPRTSMEQRSVAPVKSSAIAPSSMASSSRWQHQYVAVANGYGKPATQRLTQTRLLPRGDGGGVRGARIARGVSSAVDQRTLHAERSARNA